MKLCLIALLLCSSVPQTAQPDTVLERLAKVERFAFGPTGYAGVISAGEKDYRTVLARGSALTDLEKLLAEGNVQAKSYALVGIHKLNPKGFKELAGPFRDSQEMVSTMEGCMVLHERFTLILERIKSGKYERF